ncbi:hypothetical protein EG328_010186 [Venturia inaequalis]|uniref:Uncharacterized protein n=1 Tax=Venturia inaequalis TaxID=5025 RepID=A0A8H3Z2D7_VENIN|nr:hypothetical protein EG328_010186 [Venturia inaequalis]
MKYLTASLLLAGLATAAPVAQAPAREPHPQPTAADLERASSILGGLATGFKGSAIPGAGTLASLFSGLSGGLDKGAKVTPTKRQTRPTRPERPDGHREHREHPPPTAADMERASSILDGLSAGFKGTTVPGSGSLASLFSGLSSGLDKGSKNPPSASHPNTPALPKAATTPKAATVPKPATAPKSAAEPKPEADPSSETAATKEKSAAEPKPEDDSSSETAETKEKRQQTSPILPAPGTPEARKSAAEILQGLAKGFEGSSIAGNAGIAGILNSVGTGLQAGALLPAAPGASSASTPAPAPVPASAPA